MMELRKQEKSNANTDYEEEVREEQWQWRREKMGARTKVSVTRQEGRHHGTNNAQLRRE
jgi:hypothetical protein